MMEKVKIEVSRKDLEALRNIKDLGCFGNLHRPPYDNTINTFTKLIAKIELAFSDDKDYQLLEKFIDHLKIVEGVIPRDTIDIYSAIKAFLLKRRRHND